jgi:hypothetical protein
MGKCSDIIIFQKTGRGSQVTTQQTAHCHYHWYHLTDSTLPLTLVPPDRQHTAINAHNIIVYPASTSLIFPISNFCLVLNVVFLLLGDTPAPEFRFEGITLM